VSGASAGAVFTRVVPLLHFKPGAAGRKYHSVAGTANTGASVTVTAYAASDLLQRTTLRPAVSFRSAVPGELTTPRLGLPDRARSLGMRRLRRGPAMAGKVSNGKVPNTADQSVSATMNVGHGSDRVGQSAAQILWRLLRA